MIGTVNQIAWAVQIKSQVDAEFDRVRKVLESVATKQSPNDGTDVQDIIRILEDKRAEVMGRRLTVLSITSRLPRRESL